MVKASRAETTQKRLLDAAARVVVREGWAGATTRTIAEQAGMNPALVNYHFGSKAKLLEAMVERCTRELHEATVPSDDPERALLGWIESVDELVDHPQARVLLEAIFSAIHDPELAPLMRQQLGRLRSEIAAAVGALGFRGRQERGLTQAIAALLDGLMLHRALGAELDVKAVADAVAGLLSQGAREAGSR